MSDKLQQTLDSAAFDVFRQHCESNADVEACGLFVLSADGIEFVPCENHAYDKKNSFLIHPKDFVDASKHGDVVVVGHSHTTAPVTPSTEDRTHSENCRIPFVIYKPDTGEIATYEPTGDAVPLVGRRWTLGVSDCYSLVRDYYGQQGVELRDYVRNDRNCLFNDDRFVRLYGENGFTDVTGQAPRIHDLALIQILADIPNHAAVFVSEHLILHHLQGRLSCRDPYGGYWQRHTAKLLRHQKWL